MAAPRGVELDDGVLAGLEHRGVKVVAAEDGHLRGGDAQAEREEQREGLHHRAIGNEMGPRLGEDCREDVKFSLCDDTSTYHDVRP